MIFLSQRNLNIPSSLNNPVLGSKIVGKTQKKRSEKKATKFESWLTSDNFLPCISYRTYHFHVRLFSARTETYLGMSVFRASAVDFYSLFIFQSSFILLNQELNASRQDLCHIPNDLLMWKPFHFPRQNISSQLLFLIPRLIKWR